jgi:tetratricopeptide (TPR) repeat protein
LGTALVALLLMGWSDAQQARSANSDLSVLLDNDIRLYLAGMAISCIGLHPWVGGGSRSYSWECYRFWDYTNQGWSTHSPDLVHNELLQAATDYGLVGAGLLLVLLLTITLVAFVRSGTSIPNDQSSCNAWRLGGLAAFFGMFAQSNFSFVFHIIPQTILLGACLGFAAHSSSQDRMGSASSLVSKLMITGIAMLCAAGLIPYGVKGSKVTLALWPSMFSKTLLTSPEARMSGLTAAIQIWPQSQFYLERAGLYRLAVKDSGEGWSKTDEIKHAIRDYNTARVLHSYDPAITVNQGLLFSGLNRDSEAEEAFEMTTKLQGGMESIFAGHYYFANHLFQKGLRTYRGGDSASAIEHFKLAAGEVESALRLVPGRGTSLQIAIHESLGAALEETHDFEGAMKSYDFTCTILSGQSAHYRAGALLGRMAVQDWTKRDPSLALARFIAAKNRIGNHVLPAGISVEQRAAYLAYLDKNIKFLEGANIKPAPLK